MRVYNKIAFRRCAPAGNEAWYDQHVVYPMGYGLSYTSFEWNVDFGSLAGASISGTEKYEVTVTVTNTGAVAGKDVVQLYGRAPYNYTIEKPYEVLLDFAKTELLQPGETSDPITLTFDPYYLASFDYNNANDNDFSGYELEAGDYSLAVCRNAHDSGIAAGFAVAEGGILFKSDPVTGTTVAPLYTGNENAYLNSDYMLGGNVLSRLVWDDTFPAAPTAEDRVVTEEFIAALGDRSPNGIAPAEEETSLTEYLTMRDLLTDEEGNYGFAEGADAWAPIVSYTDERWSKILDECSTAELLQMINLGAFKSEAIEGIGKPLTNDTDGPAGFVNFMMNDGTYWNTCYYAAQIVIASTWSEEIAQGFGEMVGEEGIIGADGRGNGLPCSGWYAPGANIHRSQFGGRNFEYMSEDSVLTGKMAAAQIRGCQSKGVYCFMKHFVANDQETHRSNNGVAVWLTEQALREVYLRPFEIAVKEGGTRAVMSSFNRIGTRWTGGDYRLITTILRDEWGFEGTVVTDFTSGSYMNARQMAYAGGSLNLNNQEQYNWADFNASDPSDVAVLRARAKDILYTVVNSNAFNREVVGYNLPVWEIWLIVADCAVVVGVAVWGFFAIRKAGRKIASGSSSSSES